MRPSDVIYGYDKGSGKKPLRRQESGQIVDGDWDLGRYTLDGQVKLSGSCMHFIDGVPRDLTPLFERMLRAVSQGRGPMAVSAARMSWPAMPIWTVSVTKYIAGVGFSPAWRCRNISAARMAAS
jgi:hypothetical protein